MSEEAPQPLAGWYPTPDGGQRYWDGTTWLALPAPADGPTQVPKRHSRRRTAIVSAVIGAVLLIGGGSGVIWKVSSDQEVARQAAAVAATERQQQKDQENEAQRAADAEEADDAAERTSRADRVPAIESSVSEMAVKHHTDGLIDAPPIGVSCSPTAGGSTDDLTEQTTVFDCFVSTVDNGDGTSTGYNYHATMNWSTGEYTYGFGAR